MEKKLSDKEKQIVKCEHRLVGLRIQFDVWAKTLEYIIKQEKDELFKPEKVKSEGKRVEH